MVDVGTYVAPAMELIYESGVPEFRSQWDILLPEMVVEHPVAGSGDWESPYLALRGERPAPPVLNGLGDTPRRRLEADILQDNPRGRLREMDARDDRVHLISAGPAINAARWLPSNLAAGVLGAYNRYVVDYCAADSSRLRAAIQVHGLEPEWSALEIRAMAGEPCVSVVSICLPVKIAPEDPRFATIWRALDETRLPLLHRASFSAPGWTPRHLLAYLGFADIFERYPSVRVAFAETGVAWVRGWVDHLERVLAGSRAGGRDIRAQVAAGRVLAAVSVTDDVEAVEAAASDLGEDALLWESHFPFESRRGSVHDDRSWCSRLNQNGERFLGTQVAAQAAAAG